MRKSKDITKYSTEWQLTRLQCKSKEGYQAKVDHAMAYLEAHKNKHAYERVVNWMEGLERGYRGKNDFASFAVNTMAQEVKARIGEFNCALDSDNASLEHVEANVIKALYKDLCKRQGGWMKGGYVHKEQAAFEDMLASELSKRGVSVDHNVQLHKRQNASEQLVSHKFFF